MQLCEGLLVRLKYQDVGQNSRAFVVCLVIKSLLRTSWLRGGLIQVKLTWLRIVREIRVFIDDLPRERLNRGLLAEGGERLHALLIVRWIEDLPMK